MYVGTSCSILKTHGTLLCNISHDMPYQVVHMMCIIMQHSAANQAGTIQTVWK